MMSEERYGKNRSKHDIVREILAVVSKRPVSQTNVMYDAHLSWIQVKMYHEILMAKGLVAMDANGFWQATQKGIEKLKVLEEALA